jgi:hypothetical protein
MKYRIAFISLAIAAVILGTGLFGVLNTAKAQGVQATSVVSDPAAEMRAIKEKNLKELKSSWSYGMITALTTAIDTTAQRIAAASATWVASGSLSQGPLIFTTEFGEYGKGIFLDTFSDALNSFSKTTLGFGLCEPMDAKVSLRIKLGIARVNVPKPACSWNKFKKAMEDTGNNITSGRMLQGIGASFEMDKAADNKANKLAERLSTNGFKDLVAPISGATKTPASIIESNIENDVVYSPTQKQILTEGAMLNNMDILSDVGANVGKVFLSTLTSKILEKYLKKGMVSVFDAACSLSSGSAFDLCRSNYDWVGDRGGFASIGIFCFNFYAVHWRGR